MAKCPCGVSHGQPLYFEVWSDPECHMVTVVAVEECAQTRLVAAREFGPFDVGSQLGRWLAATLRLDLVVGSC